MKAAGDGKLATLLKSSMEDVTTTDVLDVACRFPIVKLGCKAAEAVGLKPEEKKEGKRLRRRAIKESRET